MRNYLDYLQDILDNGQIKGDRTGTGTVSVFGRQMRWDLSKGFPAVTTKKLAFKAVVVELLWFLRGDTNIKFLKDHGVTIWDEWADENGDLGPVYGSQWRSWPAPNGQHIDQIAKVLESLKQNPNSRRHMVSAWNPAEVDSMALPPCHALFQFYVSDDRKLSCQLYQRSVDSGLGLPFNIASYALLTHVFALHLGYSVGDFVWTGGDCHIYLNHVEALTEQLTREPRELPQLLIRKAERIEDYIPEDFALLNYDPYATIKMEISV